MCPHTKPPIGQSEHTVQHGGPTQRCAQPVMFIQRGCEPISVHSKSGGLCVDNAQPPAVGTKEKARVRRASPSEGREQGGEDRDYRLSEPDFVILALGAKS